MAPDITAHLAIYIRLQRRSLRRLDLDITVRSAALALAGLQTIGEELTGLKARFLNLYAV